MQTNMNETFNHNSANTKSSNVNPTLSQYVNQALKVKDQQTERSQSLAIEAYHKANQQANTNESEDDDQETQGNQSRIEN
jgi:hypothetical protein